MDGAEGKRQFSFHALLFDFVLFQLFKCVASSEPKNTLNSLSFVWLDIHTVSTGGDT